MVLQSLNQCEMKLKIKENGFNCKGGKKVMIALIKSFTKDMPTSISLFMTDKKWWNSGGKWYKTK